MRQVLVVGLFPLCLEIACAEYPLVTASMVCGRPWVEVSVHCLLPRYSCNRKCDLKVKENALCETRGAALPGVVVGSPCQLGAVLL